MDNEIVVVAFPKAWIDGGDINVASARLLQACEERYRVDLGNQRPHRDYFVVSKAKLAGDLSDRLQAGFEGGGDLPVGQPRGIE